MKQNKVLYNVTVVVDPSIHDEWKQWMIQNHIPDMMATGCFTEYKMSLILGSEAENGLNYAIQYVAPSMDVFLKYRDQYSTSLQKEHQIRYKDRYASFRTVMEIHDEGQAL